MVEINGDKNSASEAVGICIYTFPLALDVSDNIYLKVPAEHILEPTEAGSFAVNGLNNLHKVLLST